MAPWPLVGGNGLSVLVVTGILCTRILLANKHSLKKKRGLINVLATNSWFRHRIGGLTLIAVKWTDTSKLAFKIPSIRLS